MNALVALVVKVLSGRIPTSKLEYVSNAEVKAILKLKLIPRNLKQLKLNGMQKGKKSTLNERLKGFKDLTTKKIDTQMIPELGLFVWKDVSKVTTMLLQSGQH